MVRKYRSIQNIYCRVNREINLEMITKLMRKPFSSGTLLASGYCNWVAGPMVVLTACCRGGVEGQFVGGRGLHGVVRIIE